MSLGSLDDRDWRNLLRDIHAGQVVPVIGPELITIPDPAGGGEIPLHRYLAPRLAKNLGLPEPERFITSNEAACAHLIGGGARKDIYDEIRELIDGISAPPSQALLDLARISDFKFIIASVFDHQLRRAMESVRADFDPLSGLLSFHPSQAVDIPEPLPGSFLYHILGNVDTYPDFAVWEEDYMEFICGLIEHQDTMERLFRLLKNRQLLLLGSPASDWIVRFFLRVTRQTRLSDRNSSSAGEYLADRGANLEPPLVFFCDKIIHATRVIDGDPCAFVRELSARWQERYGQGGNDDDFLSRMSGEMPRDSVFISYASDNRDAAIRLGRSLHAAGVPVWMDKGRLQAGQNYETSLEAAVRVHSSFFISLISAETEADTERLRYVHKERDWAAGRHVDGFIYYIPVAIFPEAPTGWKPVSEPPCFSRIHFHKIPDGEAAPDFIRYIRQLIETYRVSGRPRG